MSLGGSGVSIGGVGSLRVVSICCYLTSLRENFAKNTNRSSSDVFVYRLRCRPSLLAVYLVADTLRRVL